MTKAWLIAKREFITNIRKRSFLFGAFGVPIFVIAMLFVVFAIIADTEDNVTRIGNVGYVDQAGVLTSQVDKPDTFAAYDTEAAARAALEAEEIGAYFVIPADYMETGAVTLVSQTTAPSALKDQFDAYLIANLGSDLDATRVQRLINPVNETLLALDSGRRLEGDAFLGLFFTPFIFVFVFLMGTQMTSTYLMSGVVEEKTNRIMEILITTVTPFQLMFGKIVGLGALGLVQLGVWLGAGLIVVNVGQALPALQGVIIPADIVIASVIYFLLGYFLQASVMAGIGAVVASEQESRQYAGIFSLLFSIPFFLILSFFTDPNGPVVTFLCLFPFTSPVSVIMRMGFGSIPVEQLILSIVILLATTVLVTWISARVFRWALLLYGKRPSLRQVIAVLRRRAPAMATTVSVSAPESAGR